MSIISYEEFKLFWEKEPIIMFDTNILLRLYEYSPETGDFILNQLDSIKENIYLPHHVINEFEKHHIEILRRQRKKYSSLVNSIKTSTNSVNAKLIKQIEVLQEFRFPQIDQLKENCNDKLVELIQIFEEYIEDNKVLESINDKYLNSDKVGILVNNLKELANVTPSWGISKLYEIYTEGEMRFNYNIPPGNKDKSKEGIDKFGDLVIWKQICDFGILKGKDIIFVTDDVKRDWWDKNSQNQIEGLRNELINEFNDITNREILGLTANNFYDLLATVLGIETPPQIVHILRMSADEILSSYIENEYYDNDFTSAIDFGLSKEEVRINMIEPNCIYTFDDITEATFLEVLETIYEDERINYNVKVDVKLVCLRQLINEIEEDYYNIEDYGVSELTGSLILKFIKSTALDICDFRFDDNYFENIELISGELNEKILIYQEDICSICGESEGVYHHYDGSLVCKDCGNVDNYKDICPDCGRIVPHVYMAGDGFCKDCSGSH